MELGRRWLSDPWISPGDLDRAPDADQPEDDNDAFDRPHSGYAAQTPEGRKPGGSIKQCLVHDRDPAPF